MQQCLQQQHCAWPSPGPVSAPGPLPDYSMTDPSPLTTCLPCGRQSHERRMCQPHDRAAASCWDRCYARRRRSQELRCRIVGCCCCFPSMPSASSCSCCNSRHARMAWACCRHPELQRKFQLQCNSLHAKCKAVQKHLAIFRRTRRTRVPGYAYRGRSDVSAGKCRRVPFMELIIKKKFTRQIREKTPS